MATPSWVTQPQDMARCRAEARRLLGDPGQLPVTFRLDGRTCRGMPAAWQPVSRRRQLDANLVETVIEGRDPDTGMALRVEAVEYQDYPVLEWTAWLTHGGRAPTPIIADLRALDSLFAGPPPVLWHSNGDFYSAEGYQAFQTPLQAGQEQRFAPVGGRPCDRAFPYYRLRWGDQGMSLAIGWPGQWAAAFAATEAGLRIQAGQEHTHLRLQPGETIRTPRLTLMWWTGDDERAANQWRRWHRDHLRPRPDGQPLSPRLVGHGTDEGEEFTAATEANQCRYLDRWAARGIPISTWWIDAGWYPCYDSQHQRRWPETGTWVPDPERFPTGMGAVAAKAAAQGAGLLLWFEPERVRPGTQLDREHPEWLLSASGTDNRLLNLGRPDCRQWLTDHVSRVISDNGIRVYRQDFNFEPLAHWRENDAPDRQGMNENLHVQGYLQYWDELLARHPGLWIDSCASGGRRNDLETMRRAVPLHYTDYGYGNHPVKLSFHHVLCQWLPYFKEVTLSWDLVPPARFDAGVDSFSYHCGFGPMMAPAIDIARDDYDYPLMRRLVAIWERAAGTMLDGDYYPLAPIHRSPKHWVVRQFDHPETGIGWVQGIRLPACAEGLYLARCRGLDPRATYRCENPESGQVFERTGAQLQQGLLLAAPARGAVIWFYQRMG